MAGAKNGYYPLIKQEFFPLGLGNIWINQPKVVLEKGVKSSWDDNGVRDPAILVDSSGYVFYEKGDTMVMYYTGSIHKGQLQSSGRVISKDNGLSWHREDKHFIIGPGGGGWDRGLRTTPWVFVDDKGKYRMYYRGGQGIYTNEGVGLAISVDGRKFEPFSDTPLLTKEDFTDLSGKLNLMGVINVVQTFDRKYLLTFEGHSKSMNENSAIFGALSDDGYRFTPLNEGFPMFSSKWVTSWPVKNVANPRVMVFEDKQIYLLCYNGYLNSMHYALGLAYSTDLKTWIDHPKNPLLLPSGEPLTYPFSGRLEGGVLLKDEVCSGKGPMSFFFMSIPRKGPNHSNGVIARSEIIKGISKANYNFNFAAPIRSEVYINESQELAISSENAEIPTLVYFTPGNKKNIVSFSCELKVKEASAKLSFGLVDEMAPADFVNGFKFFFKKNQLYFEESKPISRHKRNAWQRFKGKYAMEKPLDWIEEKITALKSRLLKSNIPHDSWVEFKVIQNNDFFEVYLDEVLLSKTNNVFKECLSVFYFSGKKISFNVRNIKIHINE